MNDVEVPQVLKDTFKKTVTPPSAGFVLPFLGRIQARVAAEPFAVKIDGTKSMTLSFRVFYDSRGRFLRAEYVNTKAPGLEASVTDIEDVMGWDKMRYLGFGSKPPEKSWKDIIGLVANDISLEGIKRLNITYLDCAFRYGPPRSVYIVNEIGVNHPLLNSYEEMPNAEVRRRARYIIQSDGTFETVDNSL